MELFINVNQKFADTIIMEDGKLELAGYSETNISTLEHMVIFYFFFLTKLFY